MFLRHESIGDGKNDRAAETRNYRSPSRALHVPLADQRSEPGRIETPIAFVISGCGNVCTRTDCY